MANSRLVKGVIVGSRAKVLFFDHGGVLTPGGAKDTNVNAAALAMGLPRIAVPDLNEALKRGQISNEQFVDEINQRYPNAPRKLTSEVWVDIYRAMSFDLLAYRFASQCKEAGFEVGILTNINPTVATLLRNGGAYKNYPVVASCDVKAAKPDEMMYRAAESIFPRYKPSQFVMIDDQQKCVDGAVRCGWQGVLATSTPQMIEDVSRLIGLA